MADEIMVSISCITYNHEKYIRHCLDSLLMQKTNFKYDIIVHDDASTDNTANIIREYEKKYPDVIKPIYQSENQYSKGIKIGPNFITPIIKGKYVAFCEGDDFWTDPYKLQKQFDIMEKNPDCSICTHRVEEVLENEQDNGTSRPKFKLKDGKINLKNYFDFDNPYPFQTSSYFIRFDLKKEFDFNPPTFVNYFKVGDEPMILFSLTKGYMYYLDKSMSCYRLISKGSWTSQYFNDSKKRIKNHLCTINAYEAFDKYTHYEYSRQINHVCEKNKFLIALLSKEYKTCLSKKYRKYFNKYLNKKEKLAVIIYAVFPFFVK